MNLSSKASFGNQKKGYPRVQKVQITPKDGEK